VNETERRGELERGRGGENLILMEI